MRATYKLILLVIIACLSSILIYHFVDKVEPIKEIEDILVTQNKKELSILSDSYSYTAENPKIVLNPYEISPLTALLIFETKDLTAPTITIVGKDEKTTITNTFTPSKKHFLPIYGLYPDTNNEVLLTVNGITTKLSIRTEKLPEDFILPNKIEKADTVSNEFYFFTPSSKGYTAAYDSNGDVRWYLTESFIWNIQKLQNGHLLLSSNRLINPPYYTTGLMEMDLLGKIYYEYTLPGGYHHDVYEMEDGNLLIATDNFADGTVEDTIVEMDRTTGDIIKTIDLKKIIPVNEGHNLYTTDYDWFHNNSVWYDKKTNSITLSGRHQDIIINIDYDSLEINWILGDPTNWSQEFQKYFLTPIGNSFEYSYAQHAAKILPNGDLFLFDNGNNRSKTEEKISADNNYSRGVIYHIDTNNRTVEQIWQYGKEEGSNFYSPYISDVDYLGENNYSILSGGHSTINGKVSNEPAGLTNVDSLNSIFVEIKNNQPVFRMEFPTNFYRSEKMNLYGNDRYFAGMGSRLGSMGETETAHKNPFILWNKEDEKIFTKYNLKIYKEVDRLVVSGTFKKEDHVQIILDSLFKNKTYDMIISKKPYTAMCVDIFNEEEKQNGITVTKYINDIGLKGKYYIYIKINGTVYDINQYIEY
ncbi:MAG: aryl-sulfate sulfotransferase [Bacilli bacterium]|nr:aryl-sulfate sulfotransferase [Bacilli bacterium]